MAVIGPGAIQENQIAPPASLDGANEYEYVTILNPLSDDFSVRVAQEVPINMPLEIRGKTGLIQTENDIVRGYGLDLRNNDFKSSKHISNNTIIPAGQTRNFKGNEAQVAVRQLVNEVLQQRGMARFQADPVRRREIEDEIIKHRGYVQDLMEENLKSTRSQLDEAINTSNKTPKSEVKDDESINQDQPKRVGRPKKTT